MRWLQPPHNEPTTNAASAAEGTTLPESPIVSAHGNIRGTQSFVHVMASIFKRPGLVEFELTWRILAWAPLYFPLSVALGSLGMNMHFAGSTSPGLNAVAAGISFLPEVLEHHMFIFGISSRFVLTTFLLVTWWACLSALGRSFTLRKLDPALSRSIPSSILLGLMRVWAFATLLLIWLLTFAAIYKHFVLGPTARGEYPSYVLGFALFTIFTLLLFMLWSVTSWVFPLATTLAMSHRLTLTQSLRTAWADRTLRSKLIEINLVMGIVKVSLLVLTLVFSACPLPFSNVETQTFLNWWWFGCFLFWVISSDYFHVVRAAAVLRLTQAYTEA